MATANEIEIRVTVNDKTKAPFKAIENRLKTGARQAGEKAGQSFGDGFNKGFNKLKTGSFGRAFGSAATGGLKSIVSMFTGAFDLIRSGFTDIGKSVASSLGQLTGGVAGVAQSVVSLGSALALVGAIAGPATIAIGALAAVIGGSLVVGLGAGIAALGLFSQRAKDAFSQLGTDLSAELGKLAESSGLADALINMANQFRFAFGEIKAQISDAMTATAPLVASLARGITDLAQNAMPGIVSALQSAGPVFEGFKVMLGDLGTGIGEMFAALGQHAEGFRATFAGLGEVFKQVLPAIGQFAGVLADVMGPALQTMAPLLANLINHIGPLLASAIAQVTPMMPALFDGFQQVLSAIIPLIPPLTQLAVAVLPPLATAIQAAGQVITGFLVPAFQSIMPILNGVMAGIRLFISTLIAAKQAASGEFSAALDTMRAAAQQFAVDTGNAGQQAGTAFRTNLGTQISGTIGVVQTNVNQMVAQATSAQGRFSAAGSALANSFRNGWVAAANAAVAAVRRTVAQIAALLPGSPAKEGPFSGHGYTKLRGMRMMKDFMHGIRKGGAKLKLATGDAMGNTAFSIFGHKHKRGRNWGQLASGSISGLPTRTAYSGAGAPSASMLSEHYNRQSKQIRNAQRNVSASQITVTGDADGAIATMIAKLIRTGKLRIA